METTKMSENTDFCLQILTDFVKDSPNKRSKEWGEKAVNYLRETIKGDEPIILTGCNEIFLKPIG